MTTQRRDRDVEKEQPRSKGGRTGADAEAEQRTPPGGSPASSWVFGSSSFPVVPAVLPRASASRGTASAGRNEPLVSAFYPSSLSSGTYFSPVSSGLRTGHLSTLLAWSSPGLASTLSHLARTQVRGLFGLSRTSGAVARGLPVPGPLRRLALNSLQGAECTPRLIPLVRLLASHTPAPLGDASLV
ncbi:hypothetical protein T4B_10792 [Trichinella pseudospiralis]|uniref:Uncharacterized protein n=1 Tax=Trichinella pseudospiralis TaxID=6337 RepID=A0A0V1H7B0_TRIPS|nr:hypothetical protein T4B_10792 [Trichinella pseudospiralis]KRZ41641.1 hypothetical protein T4C_1496 [Trichinella pseudospiralis]